VALISVLYALCWMLYQLEQHHIYIYHEQFVSCYNNNVIYKSKDYNDDGVFIVCSILILIWSTDLIVLNYSEYKSQSFLYFEDGIRTRNIWTFFLIKHMAAWLFTQIHPITVSNYIIFIILRCFMNNLWFISIWCMIWLCAVDRRPDIP
jgi:hypothetical protein